jgi:hypothetical protein
MTRVHQPWTTDEIEVLRRDAIRIPTPELAASLGRTANAIRQMCLTMGIPRKPQKVGRPVGYRKAA